MQSRQITQNEKDKLREYLPPKFEPFCLGWFWVEVTKCLRGIALTVRDGTDPFLARE